MIAVGLCPKAKRLAGSWMCPCHGLHRKPSQPNRRPQPVPRGDRLASYHASIAARRQWEGDEMAAALVAVLERIRAEVVPHGSRINQQLALPANMKGN